MPLFPLFLIVTSGAIVLVQDKFGTKAETAFASLESPSLLAKPA